MRWRFDPFSVFRSGRSLRGWKCAILLTLFVSTATADAQKPSEAPSADSEQTAQGPIPLAEIATESELVAGSVRDIRADLSADRSSAVIAERLPALTREIDIRLRESRNILAQNPSIEILAGLGGEWRRLRRELNALNRNLSGRIHELEREIAQLDAFIKTWEQTFTAAKQSSAPAEVLGQLGNLLHEIRQARDAVQAQRTRMLSLQTRVTVQDGRVANALTALDQARESVLNRLFLRDSAPIWKVMLESHSTQALKQDSMNSFGRQWEALLTYATRQTVQLVLGVGLFAVVTGCLYWARRRCRELAPGESPTSAVFEMPVAAALILTLLVSRWMFPQAPRLMWAILGGLALVPSVLILRRLMPAQLRPLPYALLACFVLDRLRSITAAVDLLPRTMFLVEMLLVGAVSLWLISSASHIGFAVPDLSQFRNRLKAAGYFALVVSFAAWLANASGYISLATLLGNALVQSSYLALILYAALQILDELVMMILHMRPFGALGMVRRHRDLLRDRTRRGLQFLATVLWIMAVLRQLLLRDRVVGALRDFISAEVTFGSIRISAGDVLAFVITVWLAFIVSRFIRFLLDEEVYPRVNLERGLPYAISHTVHYLVLFGGFFLALAALGVDMTRVTIIAGAFSVGVGLGLQNIFNNFISGLILLFERPISIGDIVQIDDASGVVERIGVRASIIRMTNGSEIIMPNGKLISERVINWTLSTRQHGIELPITVAQGTDPGRVIKLLEKTATAHPLVTGEPPPQALFVKLGPDSFGFELRAWTDRSDIWMQIRSELAIAISSTLAAEKISIR